MPKPKIAFFDFACCEGCQLQAANLGETLLDLSAKVDFVEFREAMSEQWPGRYNVAIVEGSITDDHAEERIKRIRERSDILIAYGSCATIGGVNGMKNSFALDEIGKYVYSKSYSFFPTKKTRPVHQVVNVDYFVHGCPVYLPEFVEVLKDALRGLPRKAPDYAVCVECKLNENVCMYDRGIACLGPVTRAGCNSWCVNNNNICYGCRGMLSDPNAQGAKDVMEKHGITPGFIAGKVDMYNKCREDDTDAGKKH